MKKFSMLVATMVAIGTLTACGDEIVNNYYPTEGVPGAHTSTTIIVNSTLTPTVTATTTIIVNVEVTVTPTTSDDEPAEMLPVPGTVVVTPTTGTLRDSSAPYTNEVAQLVWRLDTTKSGVIRGMSVESAPTPGVNNAMGWFVDGCLWSFHVRGEGPSINVRCHRMGNWLVMDEPVYIEAGVPVEMIITGETNAFAPTSYYSFTVRDLIMDDGQNEENLYSVIYTSYHEFPHTMSNDTTCLGLMNSPDMNQLLVTSTGSPALVEVSSGTNGRVADVAYHACRREVMGQREPLAHVYMVHVNPSNGAGFVDQDGLRMLMMETSYQTTPTRTFGGAGPWQLVDGIRNDAFYRIQMMSLGMGSEITIGLDVECRDSFIGNEYEVYLRYWRNAPGFTDTLIGRFRCVE